MDVTFFLKQRTAFIRSFYDTGAVPFLEVHRRIQAEEQPFGPRFEESDEPPYLSEWIDAQTGVELHSRSCVSLLHDALKLYLNALQREIGFRFDKQEKAILKKSFVAGHRAALGKIFDTDWTDCAVRFDVIEQVLLARNLSQHPKRLHSFYETHDPKGLRAHLTPIFANPEEVRVWRENGGNNTFLLPAMAIDRDAFFAAAAEIDTLADWLEARFDRVYQWRAEHTKDDDEGDDLTEVYGLFAAARSALELAEQALVLFEARRPDILDQGDSAGIVVEGRRLERSMNGPLADQGLIGAQAFLSNLVIVENCIARLASLEGLPAATRDQVEVALEEIRQVVDREVRNTGEHIDERVVNRADQGLISMSILEPDFLCSTRLDGTIGMVSVSRETLDVVTSAVNALLPSSRRRAS